MSALYCSPPSFPTFPSSLLLPPCFRQVGDIVPKRIFAALFATGALCGTHIEYQNIKLGDVISTSETAKFQIARLTEYFKGQPPAYKEQYIHCTEPKGWMISGAPCYTTREIAFPNEDGIEILIDAHEVREEISGRVNENIDVKESHVRIKTSTFGWRNQTGLNGGGDISVGYSFPGTQAGGAYGGGGGGVYASSENEQKNETTNFAASSFGPIELRSAAAVPSCRPSTRSAIEIGSTTIDRIVAIRGMMRLKNLQYLSKSNCSMEWDIASKGYVNSIFDTTKTSCPSGGPCEVWQNETISPHSQVDGLWWPLESQYSVKYTTDEECELEFPVFVDGERKKSQVVMQYAMTNALREALEQDKEFSELEKEYNKLTGTTAEKESVGSGTGTKFSTENNRNRLGSYRRVRKLKARWEDMIGGEDEYKGEYRDEG
ncbi:hypothetical protein DCS_07196 [Drechmeria coniospora]|uniref:Uncharacterized protein n=1 Tax=Drechmeria coniospora TaxID=98403 RepID=A0A151GDT8_DRECN|nr:hypothetical protein DCS_07196 [Drechmeria coniospora]KYK55234.1 hypothetical protein DCS_07196 [Drechmeria coniospora]